MGILIGLALLSLAILITTSVWSHRQIILSVTEEKQKQDERIRQRTLEIELMHRLANMLAACNNLIEAQRVVEDIVPRILGKVNGSISLMRSSRNQLVTQLDWGEAWPGSRSFAQMSVGHCAKVEAICRLKLSIISLVSIWRRSSRTKPCVFH
ncbi:hypothetical protein JCM19240_1390 [Vibrio maritimus]|uniref:Uncharacterized protein n=1 Tax=Vibrio maritimus TaxID=990268 RepID=A0A090TFB9_9VIBR|nr:hypothetical protein JCM19240_1390 [Vibrio maritimus]